MDTDIELSDLLESSISIYNPKFQELITNKFENLILEYDGSEKIEKGAFKPQKHQIFVSQFLYNYDDFFDGSDTGTGKTGSIVAFMEKTRREYEKAQIDPNSADPKLSHFKQCLILVKGKTLAESFRTQLVCKISDGRYMQEALAKSKDAKSLKSAIKRIIGKAGYVVDHYEKFASRINKLFPIDENASEEDNADSISKIAEYFSDTIFWIDEAHNLNISPDKLSGYKVKVKVYKILWIIFHVAPRCKRIISTATPMLNFEIEEVFLLNLILPRDGVLPRQFEYQIANDDDIRTFFPGLEPDEARKMTPEEIAPYFRGQIYITLPKSKEDVELPQNVQFFQSQYGVLGGTKYDGNGNERIPLDIVTATDKDLEPYLRGRYFYVKKAKSGATAVEQGTIRRAVSDIATSYITTYNTEMSKFQEKGYASSMYRDKPGSTNKRSAVYDKERQAANFVFPDGKAGGSGKSKKDVADSSKVKYGFNKYVNVEKDNFTATTEFKKKLTEVVNDETGEIMGYDNSVENIITNVGKYSCKDAAILRLALEIPGIHYDYSNFVFGSGGIVTAIGLEMLGYTRYTESTSVFVTSKVSNPVITTISGQNPPLTYCSTSSATAGRTIRIKKAKRYALLNGDETSTKDLHSMMELLNSRENMYGEYLQFLITSSTGRDGINVYNATAEHMKNPEWNPYNTYQALSRGNRVDSQDALLEEAQKIIDELSSMLSNKNVDATSDLYIRSKALITGLSGGIKINIDDVKDNLNLIIDVIELAIRTTKSYNSDLIRQGKEVIDILKLNNKYISDLQELIDVNIDAIKTIFSDRSDLYLDFFEAWSESSNLKHTIKESIEVLLLNVQDLVKNLSIRTMDINVVKEFAEIKDELLNMINEGILYNNNASDEEESKNTPTAYIELKIFKHAAFPINLIKENIEEIKSGIIDESQLLVPIDSKIYNIAEVKSHNIERILSIKHRHSVGYYIFFNRNNDIVGTHATSLLVRNKDNIDYSTYDILYSKDLVATIQKEITEICHRFNNFTLSELINLLLTYQIEFATQSFRELLDLNVPFVSRNGKNINSDVLNKINEFEPKYRVSAFLTLLNTIIRDNMIINSSIINKIPSYIEKYRRKFIIVALENLISNKIGLMDKFGYTVYLRENNGYFYLDKEYPSGYSPMIEMSYYTDNLIVIKNETLENISNVNEEIISIESLNVIKDFNDDEMSINNYLNGLTVNVRANILESIIIEALTINKDYFTSGKKNLITDFDKSYIDIVIKKYEYYIIWMHEPYVEIKNAQSQELYQGPTKGRPANVNKKKLLPTINSINKRNKEKGIINDDVDNDDNELVYIHTLYSLDFNVAKHGKTARMLNGDGRKRIMKISEINRGWRNLIEAEKAVYNKYVRPALSERNDEIVDHAKEATKGLNGNINGERLYGRIVDGVFSIIDKEQEQSQAKGDDRFKVPGRVAIFFKRPYLLDVLWRLDAVLPDSDDKGDFIDITEGEREEFVLGLLGEVPIYYQGHTGKTKMKELGKNKKFKDPYNYDVMMGWELYRLNFYYRWGLGKFTVPYLCDVIKERMIELNIMEYL
jgi:hypothetical protein